jgi:allophanate hydrolase subunit 2
VLVPEQAPKNDRPAIQGNDDKARGRFPESMVVTPGAVEVLFQCELLDEVRQLRIDAPQAIASGEELFMVLPKKLKIIALCKFDIFILLKESLSE